MHISRVLIRNFRNFKELEIDPFPRHAVIVGQNAVGKSNLLYALRLVLDLDLPESARYLRAEDICDWAGATLADGVEVRVEVELTDFTRDPAALSVLGDCIVKDDPLTARLTYIFRPGVPIEDQTRALTSDDYSWEIVGGFEDRHVDARRVRRDIRLSVLPALRDATRDLSRWRDSPLHELLESLPPTPAALLDAANSIQMAMDELADDVNVAEIASDLTKRLTDLGGHQMDVTPTLGFASSSPERLLRSTQLFTDPGRVRSVGDASTGHANVIYLGLLLERLAARRKREAILDSVLAVEEPEAHLHPVLQRQLFRSLLRGEAALTVTTHSPHIVAVSPLYSLVLLRSTVGDGTVAATAAGAELTNAQRTDLERYLDVSRAELLFCRAALLVEGASEKYLLPALARALGFDLDAYGVIVADVSGTDFAPYGTLLGEAALGVDHVIVTDGDPVSHTRADERYVYAGLRRAANLLDNSSEAGMPLGTQVEELVRVGANADLTQARLRAAEGSVFVGLRTLEVDLAPLLPVQLAQTYGELVTSGPSVKRFTSAIADLASGTASAESRDYLLRRIDYIGKGRFAQRLAAHVDSMNPEALRAAFPGIFDPWNDFLYPRGLETAELMAAGSYGYLFAALDRVSRTVRGRGLVLPEPASSFVPAEQS